MPVADKPMDWHYITSSPSLHSASKGRLYACSNLIVKSGRLPTMDEQMEISAQGEWREFGRDKGTSMSETLRKPLCSKKLGDVPSQAGKDVYERVPTLTDDQVMKQQTCALEPKDKREKQKCCTESSLPHCAYCRRDSAYRVH